MLQTHAGGRKEQRKQPPCHAVIEIIDEPCLADRRQITIGEGRAQEHLALARQLARRGSGQRSFVIGMMRRLANQQDRQQQPAHDEADAEIKRLRPQSPDAGGIAGRERRSRHREIPCKLVQAHRQSAALRPREIDLHDHGRGPGEALADAEQQIGKQNPGPGRRPHQDEWHGHRNEPARDEDQLAADSVRQMPRKIIGERLADAEDDDERQHCSPRRQRKFVFGDRRQNAAFQAHHRTDERIDDDEQRELPQVGAQAQDGCRCLARSLWQRSASPALAAPELVPSLADVGQAGRQEALEVVGERRREMQIVAALVGKRD